jgi:glycosyltransferase involved in cell wall biosynthesis
MPRLLTIGHSYVVAENRRLAHEMTRQGRGRWDVTVAAPQRFRGDLRVIDVERLEGESALLRIVRIRWQRVPHLMSYAGLTGLMRGSWDVVHCWEEPYVRAGAQVARHVPPRAIFVPATFQNISKRYPWPFGAYERNTMARADGWIAFGETVRATLAERPAYAARPVAVIPPGVDLERFAPNPAQGGATRRALGWEPTDRVVGFLGRFIEEKGVRVLCEALERLATPWRALFVGGGPLEAQLRSFERKHRPNVAVVTGVRHQEVPSWLNAMSVLCAPSQTTQRWREQFGRMLIEAMACGVPIVASDSGEMPSVVGDAGIVVGEREVDGWAAAISRLLGDDDERRSLAERGISRARAQFSWPVVAAAHLRFFESVLEAHR